MAKKVQVHKRKYRSQTNYWDFNDKNNIKKGEDFNEENEPSLTIPDMALSVKDILTRFSRGGEVRQLQPQYLEGELTDEQIANAIDLNQVDYFDRIELLGRTTKYIDQVRADIIQRQEIKKQQEAEEAAAVKSESKE